MPPAVDTKTFRLVCSQFATGITLATVCSPDGTPHGMTVNSFTSVSLEPPLVAVCIARKASIHRLMLLSKYFGINVLKEGQKELSNHFARPSEDRFRGLRWRRSPNGVPLLDDVLAQMECHVLKFAEAGDHTIVIGEVVCAKVFEGNPLLYFGSEYRKLDLVKP